MQLSDQQIRMLRYAVEQRLLWKHADLRLVEQLLAGSSQADTQHGIQVTVLLAQLERMQTEASITTAADRTMLRRYLELQVVEHRRLKLQLPDTERHALGLNDIYVELEAQPPVDADPETDTEKLRSREHTQTVTSVAAIARQQALVVLGEPGGGKSTVAKHLALQLADVLLGETCALQEYSWPYCRPHLPIFIELRAFVEWLRNAAQPDLQPINAVWCYVEERFKREGLEEPTRLRDLLRRFYEQYGAILFLDGFDEIAADNTLGYVRDMLQVLKSTLNPPSHLVVTCRVRDYQARQLSGWPTTTLLPLSSQLQERFIERWYTTISRLNYKSAAECAELAQSLIQQVQRSRDLTRLAPYPLLLTMMTQLHSRKRLPDSRIELYGECVDVLLYAWREQDTQQRLAAALDLGTAWTREHTRDVLGHLGYRAHELETVPDPERAADLPEQEVIQVGVEFFTNYLTQAATPQGQSRYGRAESFLKVIAESSNGLFQQVNQTIYAFPHRTFQEYFAAMRLNSDLYWPEELDELGTRWLHVIDNEQWHEVLKVAISAFNTPKDIKIAAQALEEMVETCDLSTNAGAKRAGMIAELLNELNRDMLTGVRRYKELPATLINHYLWPLVEQPAPAVDLHTRFNAGLLLGTFGDPRPGVATLEPDWVEIPTGPFLCGSSAEDEYADSDEKPQQTINLPCYWISRYPVTNAQYTRFIEAGGYINAAWWPAGWEECLKEGWTAPREWDDPDFNHPNQLVVAISLYESLAYCTWLSEQLGYVVTLPTDAEWEKAARGADGRRYPWGNTWQPGYANSAEAEFRRTSPVGMFPQGHSPCGALDMAGNVWEWTLSAYQNDDRTNRLFLVDIKNKIDVSLCGGAWDDDPRFLRCASRYWSKPYSGMSYLGFRLLTCESAKYSRE